MKLKVLAVVMTIALVLLAAVGFSQTLSNNYLSIKYEGYSHGAYGFSITGENYRNGGYNWNFTVNTNLSNPQYSTYYPGGYSQRNATSFSITAAQLSGAVISFCVSSNDQGNNSCIDFVIGDLPITLTSFTAQTESDGVHFAWATSMEQNVDHFELWDVTDSANATMVGTMATLATDGNSNSPLSYVFTLTTAKAFAASFGIVVLLGLAIGMVFKGRKMLIPIGCVMLVSMVSCSHKDMLTPPKTETKTYQLREIDKDGTVNYMKNEVTVQVTN